MNNQPVSFAIGDVVQFNPEKKHRFIPTGKVKIITAAEAYDGSVEYGINGCAWFDHDDLLLVERATKRTVAKASRHNDGE